MSASVPGTVIRQQREKAGLSQHGLARKASMSRSHLTRIEGGRHSPTWDTLERIAKALGVTAQSLLNAKPPKRAA